MNRSLDSNLVKMITIRYTLCLEERVEYFYEIYGPANVFPTQSRNLDENLFSPNSLLILKIIDDNPHILRSPDCPPAVYY